jgi:hypothetical protein
MSKKLIKKFKKETRVQSAMEYLMTYGWSILIIAIALVTLFQLGYFNTNKFSPSACLSQAGFLCTNLILNSTGNLTLTIGNNQGENLIITGVGCSNSSAAPNIYSPVLLELGEGQQKNLTFMCKLQSQSLGSSFKGSLWVQLNDGQQEELGSASATVSTGGQTGSTGSNGQGIIYISDFGAPSNILELNVANGNILNLVNFGVSPIYNPFSIASYGQNIYIVSPSGYSPGSGDIIVYNTQTNQFSSINSPLFRNIFGIALYGSNAYITNPNGGEFGTGNLIIYNTQTNQFSSIDSPLFDYSEGITFYGSNAYIANEYGGPSNLGNIIVYNTQTNQLSSIDSSLFFYPSEIAFSGSNAYISNEYVGGPSNNGNIIIYNTQTNQLSSFDSPDLIGPTYITKSGSDLYIYNSGSSNMLVYNPSQNAIVNSITTISRAVYSITGMYST